MDIDPDLYPWISATAIAWGLLDCFFGYRIFKLTIAIFGGLSGALLGHAASLALQLNQGGMIAAMIVGGVAGAVVAFLVYLGAVFLAGFGFGLTLGILIMAGWNHTVAVLGGCVLGVATGFVAVKLQRPLIALSTALLGAFRAILALSFFTQQLDWIFYFRQPMQIAALIDGNPWMFPAVLVLAAIGTISQLEQDRGGGGKKSRDKND